jgi:hypothetical protein
VLSGRGLCEGPIPRPESPTDCSVSLCVIKCNNTRNHAQVERGWNKKERRKKVTSFLMPQMRLYLLP